MKRIEYAADGEPIADQVARERAIAFLKSGVEYIKVSSETFIAAVRALIHDGRFPHQEVVFLYKGEELHPDRHGRMQKWPIGFCDAMTDSLMRLLDKPGDPHRLETDATIIGNGSPIDAAVERFTNGKLDAAALLAVLASNGIPGSLVDLIAGMAVDYPIRA